VHRHSLPQILVLRAIVAAESSGRPALSASDVAQDLQCSRANASDLVAVLHRRRALVKRRDPTNGRIIRIHPTTKGRMAEYHAGAVLAECGGTAFQQLEPAEKQILVTLLEKLLFA
jgi:DNA-binding MarR family transcriptional regulator